MKILYDHQIFEIQKFGGVSKYFTELIHNSNSIPGIDIDISIVHSDNVYLKSLENTKYLPLPQGEFLQSSNKFNQNFIVRKLFDRYIFQKQLGKHHKINKEKSIQILEKQDFDVFHPTYYDDYFLKFLKNKPFVLTVHDLTHQIFPEYFSPKWIDKSQLMLDEAKRIIVVSENTKKDLIEYYNVDQEKVDVVHLASSILTGTQQNGLVINTESRKKYLLYIGSRASYKNFYFFVQALIPLFNADKELFLMCTGEEFTEEEFFFLSKLGIANKVKHVFVTEKNLAEVYLNSIAFVFPSLYEGFGMPILEAFACGCPVICSDSSSFPEIAGEAAIYFEPKSKQSIYQSISNLLNDDDLRKNMIIKGFKQLEKFSWLKTVAQTRDVYLKAISK